MDETLKSGLGGVKLCFRSAFCVKFNISPEIRSQILGSGGPHLDILKVWIMHCAGIVTSASNEE